VAGESASVRRAFGTRTLAAASGAALLLAGGLPAGAAAASSEPPPPAAAPAPPSAPVPPPPAAPSGRMRLVLQRVGGNPVFALAGRRIVVRGIVAPYVAGQQVKLSFYLSGRKVAVKTASVLALGNGTG
jgi:hypothetical protein